MEEIGRVLRFNHTVLITKPKRNSRTNVSIFILSVFSNGPPVCRRGGMLFKVCLVPIEIDLTTSSF